MDRKRVGCFRPYLDHNNDIRDTQRSALSHHSSQWPIVSCLMASMKHTDRMPQVVCLCDLRNR